MRCTPNTTPQNTNTPAQEECIRVVAENTTPAHQHWTGYPTLQHGCALHPEQARLTWRREEWLGTWPTISASSLVGCETHGSVRRMSLLLIPSP